MEVDEDEPSRVPPPIPDELLRLEVVTPPASSAHVNESGTTSAMAANAAINRIIPLR
jgi:hypothetical protein